MPTYDFKCAKGHDWEVMTYISRRDDPSSCPTCGDLGERSRVYVTNINGADDWNKQAFNPALGCYTKSDAEARKIAKTRGMTEIGSEPVENVHKHFDKQREETKAKRWSDADRVMKYD